MLGGGATWPSCHQSDSTLLVSLLVHQIDESLTPGEYEALLSAKARGEARDWMAPKKENSWKELKSKLTLLEKPKLTSLARISETTVRYLGFAAFPLAIGLIGWLGPLIPRDMLFLDACLLIAPFALPMALWVFVVQKSDKDLQKKLPIWGSAKSEWGKLWYCARDNGAFIAGKNRLIPPDQMRSFLYEQKE